MTSTPLHLFAFSGLLLYFAILIFIVLREKKNQNALDYFFAGRSLPFWALSLTFIASWWGAGSALSTADLAFEDGLGAFWYYGVPVLLSCFFMFIASGAIRRVNHLTQGQMMAGRYSPLVAKLLSVMILLFMIFTAASQMVGIGQFFGQYMGMNYEVAVLVGTGIVLLYSLFGGFRGVVLTDIIQFALLLLAAIAVFVVAWSCAGGWDAIALAAEQSGKSDFMSLGAGFEKYAVYVITFSLAWAIQANVWQRISATRDVREAKRMTGMSLFAFIPLYLIVVLTGMAGIVLYKELPEGGIVSAIVLNEMSPLMGAFVFVGISAAIMSTMDSLLNTAAMTWTLDIQSKGNQLRTARYATLGATLIALLIALQIRSILEISWIAADLITTGAFVPLILGYFWKRGNNQAALASMTWALLYCGYNLAIQLGLNLPTCWQANSAAQVAYGLLVSLILYVGISLLRQSKS